MRVHHFYSSVDPPSSLFHFSLHSLASLYGSSFALISEPSFCRSINPLTSLQISSRISSYTSSCCCFSRRICPSSVSYKKSRCSFIFPHNSSIPLFSIVFVLIIGVL